MLTSDFQIAKKVYFVIFGLPFSFTEDFTNQQNHRIWIKEFPSIHLSNDIVVSGTQLVQMITKQKGSK